MSQRKKEREREKRSEIHACSRAYVSLPMIKHICIIKHNSSQCDELANCVSFCESLCYTHKRARMCVYPRVYNPFYTCTENTHHQPQIFDRFHASFADVSVPLSCFCSILVFLSLSLSLCKHVIYVIYIYTYVSSVNIQG